MTTAGINRALRTLNHQHGDGAVSQEVQDFLELDGRGQNEQVAIEDIIQFILPILNFL